ETPDSNLARILSTAHERVISALHDGQSVVFDAASLFRRHREILYDIAKDSGAEPVLCLLDTPFDRVFQRNLSRTQCLPPEVLIDQLLRQERPTVLEAPRIDINGSDDIPVIEPRELNRQSEFLIYKGLWNHLTMALNSEASRHKRDALDDLRTWTIQRQA